MDLDIRALGTSFDHIAARDDELVDVFYERLFADAPSVQPLFADTDLKRPKAMLPAALVRVPRSLRDLDPLTPKLPAMGARHVLYGARPEHYPVVADALTASMADRRRRLDSGARARVDRSARRRGRRDARRSKQRRARHSRSV
jgi:hemoglobin-like flavoprotein